MILSTMALSKSELTIDFSHYLIDMLNVVILNVVMLNVIILNVVMLNVVIMNVIRLNVVMLNVVMLRVVASSLGTWFVIHNNLFTS